MNEPYTLIFPVLHSKVTIASPEFSIQGIRRVLKEEVVTWLTERGTDGVDWLFDTVVVPNDKGKLSSHVLMTFLDENVALEFKLTWL